MTDQTPAAAEPATEAAPAAPAPDWRAGLPDDLRKQAERFASPADAVRGVLSLRRKLSNAVAVPAKDAPEEEWSAFYNRLGRPEAPDGYTIARREDLPEHLTAADPERERSFLELMHKAGASAKTVQAAFDWYYDQLVATDAAVRRQRDEGRQRIETQLRRDWGADYDRNVEYARRAADAYASPEFLRRLDETGLGNDPAFLETFARIGRQLGEDDMIAGTPPAGATRQKLEERQRELMANPSRWRDRKIDQELREIAVKLYGTREIGPGAAA